MEKTDFIKETAKEDKTYVHKLDDAIKYLANAKKRGENIYLNFNGNKLYSLLDDEDSCYVKIVGMNKKEFDEQEKKYMEEFKKRREKEQEQRKVNIPKWIERGLKLIYPQRAEDWEICVNSRAKDIYNGAELNNALDIMECLNENGSLEDANKILSSMNHSGASYSLVMSIVANFCKRGPEFYEEIFKNKMRPDQKEFLKQIEKENEQFEKELNNPEKE